MSDPTDSYDDWARHWLEGQQRAWQAWLGGGSGASPAGDPAEALAGWLGDDDAVPGGELGGRMLAQGRQFLQLAEALGESLTEATRGDGATDWQEVFDATVERVRATLDPGGGSGHPAGALEGLLDEWRRVAARMELPVGADDGGPMAAYLAALHAYTARLADVQRVALDRLHAELNDQHRAGGTITSLRALYDLWVDASEAAYAEAAVREPFIAAQANLAHALCRLRAAGVPADAAGEAVRAWMAASRPGTDVDG